MLVVDNPRNGAGEVFDIVPCYRLGLSIQRGEVSSAGVGILAGEGVFDELVDGEHRLTETTVTDQDVKAV